MGRKLHEKLARWTFRIGRGWLAAPLLPSPICYTHKILAPAPSVASHRPWYRPPSRFVCGAALTRSCSPAAHFLPNSSITAYQLCPASTLPAYSFTDYTTQALFYPATAAIYNSASLQPRSYPCIFTLSILYTCLSFVPALNFDIRT